MADIGWYGIRVPEEWGGIDADIFLATQSQNYWSNTSGISNINSAWVYQFSSGLNSLHAKTSNVYLRLVRYEK